MAALVGYPELRWPSVPPNCEHVYHLVIASYDKGAAARDTLMDLLRNKYRVQTIVQCERSFLSFAFC
eukprot:SAG11_NODE_3547_length_2377_cov_3.176471_1_plen_67_part_00